VVRFGRSDLPTHDSYVMAHRCRRCKAAPGEPCNYKRRTLAALDKDPSVRVHVTRSDAGTRHFYRDLGKAPWPEARGPGKRYDTLPR
jgi:hypothetical protein